MSVSISDGGKVDLDAVLAGGDGFLQRVKVLKDATAAHDAAFEKFNIGKSAVTAMQDAQAREAAAQKQLDAAKDEAAGIMGQARIAAAEIVRQGQVEIDNMMTTARDAIATLDAQAKDGHRVLSEWSEKTKTEANELLEKANAVKAEADRTLAENKKAAKELAEAQAQAKAAIDSAMKTQEALNTRLDAIRAAATL